MTVLEIGGEVDRARAGELCDRVLAALQGSEHITCDVSAIRKPDAETVDVLARIQLVAKEAGSEMRLYGACDRLRDLILFMGLEDVLRIESRREPE